MGTFLNAVKNLINSLTAKTSSTASTADMVQLHDANGNPNGKISLAELASVLGGLIFRGKNIAANTDLNDCISEVSYYVGSAATASSLQNKPSGVASGFVLFNLKPYGTHTYMVQILINRSNIYIRTDSATSGSAAANWSQWKTLLSE